MREPVENRRRVVTMLKAKIYHSESGPSNFPALVYELQPPVTKAAFPPAEPRRFSE